MLSRFERVSIFQKPQVSVDSTTCRSLGAMFVLLFLYFFIFCCAWGVQTPAGHICSRSRIILAGVQNRCPFQRELVNNSFDGERRASDSLYTCLSSIVHNRNARVETAILSTVLVLLQRCLSHVNSTLSQGGMFPPFERLQNHHDQAPPRLHAAHRLFKRLLGLPYSIAATLCELLPTTHLKAHALWVIMMH